METQGFLSSFSASCKVQIVTVSWNGKAIFFFLFKAEDIRIPYFREEFLRTVSKPKDSKLKVIAIKPNCLFSKSRNCCPLSAGMSSLLRVWFFIKADPRADSFCWQLWPGKRGNKYHLGYAPDRLYRSQWSVCWQWQFSNACPETRSFGTFI